MSEPILQVAFRHRIGSLALDAEFALSAPWTVLFALSGTGKSTVLRVIAGLVRPDAGVICCAGDDGRRAVWTDTAAGVNVPPHRRAAVLAAQEAALFPHLSVRRNVAYGLRRDATLREDEIAHRVQQLLCVCRVQDLANKMPHALSGGEKQRVALARALAPTKTRVLLLDEPFAGLDAGLRDELVADLRESVWLRNVAVLQVTHDVGEVFAVGAEVIRLSDGRVTGQGPVACVLAEERSRLLKQLDG